MYEYGVTKEGFKPLRFLEIVDIMEMKAKELYGNDIRLDPSSRLGQDIALMAWNEARIHELLMDLYHSFYIDSSEGVHLDNNLKIAGRKRKGYIASRGKVTIEGDEGLIIPKGFKVCNEDNIIFLTTKEVELKGGKAEVSIIAEKAGEEGNLPAGDIKYQFNPIAGITKVYNEHETYNGADVETDYEFRERHYEAPSTGGSSTEAIKSGVLSLEDVFDCDVYENVEMVEKDGIPAKSIHTIVYGGEEQEIANTIFKYKSGGIRAFGEKYFEVIDEDGKIYDIGFTRPVEKDIYVKVKIIPDDGYVGKEAVIRSIINYIGGFDEDGIRYKGLKHNQDVIYNQVIRSVASLNGVLDTNIELSLDGKSYVKENLEIGSGFIAITDPEKVVVEYA